jgi:hypothetical protein
MLSLIVISIACAVVATVIMAQAEKKPRKKRVLVRSRRKN